MKLSFIFLCILSLHACTSQGAYNAVKHNQCLEKTGKIYCDDIEDYESYRQKRDELLKEPIN